MIKIPAYIEKEKFISVPVFICIILAIHMTKSHSYLLFHTLAEFFSIIIGATIFILAWHTKKYSHSNFYTFIGIAYLFVAFLDLMHTLSYKGMPIFTDYEFHANQIWVVSRMLEAVSLLIFAIFMNTRKTINPYITFFIYFMYTVIMIYVVFIAHIFPVCFVPGKGQTLFKVVSEGIVCCILVISLIILQKRKQHIPAKNFNYVFISILITLTSELSFTVYIDNYDILNALGHYLKIISFYFLYLSTIATAIDEPFSFMFASIEEEKNKLAAANSAKDRFFSIIAHDLKNPIYGLNSLLEVFLEKYQTMPEREKREILELSITSSQKTISLLENLLTWAKSQTDGLTYTPAMIPLDTLIYKNIDLLQNNASAKNIIISTIGVTQGISCIADENMLNTVIRNLISNAIKFTHTNGTVTIAYSAKNGDTIIEIADTGVGMTQDEMGMLFKIDTHLSKLGTNKEKGSGLGLILCSEFIEKHGGTISVSSQINIGTTFKVVLPNKI